ncbi:hypothetical protein ACXHLW_004269, partial [Shigella dysenteriae]
KTSIKTITYLSDTGCLEIQGASLTLQRILGHTRIEQTMVYAHFAPEYLQDAISLNPLRGGTEAESVHTVSTVE